MDNENLWNALKEITDARIGMQRAGGSLSTKDHLSFRKDHALARDAVWSELNIFDLEQKLNLLSLKHIKLASKATDRMTYIKRPDLGRTLNDWSADRLVKESKSPFDLSITITDGLSSSAIVNHAIPFLQDFLPLAKSFTLAPICMVQQGRVAISDEIGSLLKARLSIILIGERPGLTSPDSMGVYMTYGPKTGNTDEKRNCISNIRNGGLGYEFAAQKLAYLVSESMHKKLSGVHLKDNFDNQLN